jgi:hypothetical protein
MKLIKRPLGDLTISEVIEELSRRDCAGECKNCKMVVKDALCYIACLCSLRELIKVGAIRLDEMVTIEEREETKKCEILKG